MIHYSLTSVNGFIKTVFVYILFLQGAFCEIEYNNLNSDGSFSFRHTNNDLGSYYHSVAGNPNNIIRGRYGSRNPSSGQVEETVYTAGPRGFRVNGPKVHRKMDLSQIPRERIGSPEDPLADPYDDPTYSFNFKTPDYSRNEESDPNGRIKGLYSYFDDIGEKHTVRYAAGANTGFEVLNAIPNSQSSVVYNAPLYKATSKARGNISVQRGTNGMYKFIATGPDQRRSEETGPDGIVRGAYSYLDDKGVQRTVEYEAGAGIGYRIIHNSVGRGTHRNTYIPNLHTDSALDAFSHTSGNDNQLQNNDKRDQKTLPNFDISSSEKSYQRQNLTSFSDKNSALDRDDVKLRKIMKPSIQNSTTSNQLSSKENDTEKRKIIDSEISSRRIGSGRNGASPKQNRRNNKPKNRYNDLNFDNDLSSIPPLITSNRRILEIGREADWKYRNRDSTIITNVGKWYIGLPPGQSVRAHVQNIDILPIGGRMLSPSEALRRDEILEESKA